MSKDRIHVGIKLCLTFTPTPNGRPKKELADKVLVTELYDWPWSGQTESVLKPCLKVLPISFMTPLTQKMIFVLKAPYEKKV